MDTENEITLQTLSGVHLLSLVESERSRELSRKDSYVSGKQYQGLRYNWDGTTADYADGSEVAPGWYVPLRHRRPSVQIKTPKLIVGRLTAMLMGEDRFPVISVEGDEEAEDYVNALAQESGLRQKMAELRDKGGTCGTGVISFAFVDGKPRLQVHKAAHVHVLRWADRYLLRPAAVLKVYRFMKTVWEDGKPKRKPFLFVRYWDETTEVLWDPVPESMASDGSWVTRISSYKSTHNYGECPVFWIQNVADSDEEDGLSDFDGLLENFDETNRLASATNKGVVANVDPTLVIREDPGANTGSLRKGSENAIFSKGGADYLELTGTSITTARELMREQVTHQLDVAGVVIADASTISGAARSAAAMRLLYMPMLMACDKLRTQYGQTCIVPLLLAMLRAAKRIQTSKPGSIYTTEDGRLVQDQPSVLLEPRTVITLLEEENDDPMLPAVKRRVSSVIERKPGMSERITLKWPPYFAPTQQDVSAAVDAAGKAKGTLISERTAVKFVQPYFAIGDLDQELVDIEAGKQLDALRNPAPGFGDPNMGNSKGDPDPEEDEPEDTTENPDEED